MNYQQRLLATADFAGGRERLSSDGVGTVTVTSSYDSTRTYLVAHCGMISGSDSAADE